MAIVSDRADAPAAIWLRGREFDSLLIFGLTSFALAAGAVVAIAPASLVLILIADNWLLGFPHLMSTFARIAPDRASVARHRFLLFGLPLIVLAATAAIALTLGVAIVATIYFYWQWYHTMRQSWGVSQLYRRKSGALVREDPRFTEALFALVPVWGLLHRLTTAPTHFLYPSLPIVVPHVPVWLADGVGVVAGAGLAWWILARVREAIEGELPVTYTLFCGSHYLIFIVGYVLMDNVSGGWVVTNIWHTGQYLMLVWMFNENVVAKDAPAGWFWSLTRGNRAGLYFLVCLVAAFAIYLPLNSTVLLGSGSLVFVLVVNQTLNFNHFITDAVIWRARRKPAGAPS